MQRSAVHSLHRGFSENELPAAILTKLAAAVQITTPQSQSAVKFQSAQSVVVT